MSTDITKKGIIHAVGSGTNKNFILNSLDQNQNISTYNVKVYTMSEKLTQGKTYTWSMRANLSPERHWVGVWFGGGSYSAGYVSRNDHGYYYKTFTADANIANYLTVYIFSASVDGMQGSTAITGTTQIDWIKIEEGAVPTGWSPNPNDSDYQLFNTSTGFIELDNKARIYKERIDANQFYEI